MTVTWRGCRERHTDLFSFVSHLLLLSVHLNEERALDLHAYVKDTGTLVVRYLPFGNSPRLAGETDTYLIYCASIALKGFGVLFVFYLL